MINIENLSHAFHDADMCKALLEKLRTSLDVYTQKYAKKIRFMEVCGTHTVSIFQSGLRALLPSELVHVSGPGCPVCVTHDSEVATFLRFAEKENVIIATFGDLIRVPAPDGRSLKHAQACGARVQIVYSPLDAVELARKNQKSSVVFLGVGFETTAPAIAGALLTAKKQNIKNFSVFSCHKLVPPALRALLGNANNNKENILHQDYTIDAFLLPGHVALILGLQPFEFIAKEYGFPAIVTGFEPAEIIHALLGIVEQKIIGEASITNAYTRAVANEGNPAARTLVEKVFQISDTSWRGLGFIPKSGLTLRKDFAEFDALIAHNMEIFPTKPLLGCKCGDVLSGKISPAKCPLFGKKCTPQNPTGPCMVSTEGSCAAWYNYNELL